MTTPTAIPQNMSEAEDWIAQAFETHAAEKKPSDDFTAPDDLVAILKAAGNDELAAKVVDQFDLDW